MAYPTWLSRKLEEKSEEVSKMIPERWKWKTVAERNDKIQMQQTEESKDNCRKAISNKSSTRTFQIFTVKLIFKIKMSNLKLINNQIYFNETSRY